MRGLATVLARPPLGRTWLAQRRGLRLRLAVTAIPDSSSTAGELQRHACRRSPTATRCGSRRRSKASPFCACSTSTRPRSARCHGAISRAPSCSGSRRRGPCCASRPSRCGSTPSAGCWVTPSANDGLDINREQLRLGQAVLFVIWPNVGRFEDYRAAEIEAQTAGRGIWNTSAPLTELPFEYRLRIDGGAPFRPVGDYLHPPLRRRARLPARARQQPGVLQQHRRRGGCGLSGMSAGRPVTTRRPASRRRQMTPRQGGA